MKNSIIVAQHDQSVYGSHTLAFALDDQRVDFSFSDGGLCERRELRHCSHRVPERFAITAREPAVAADYGKTAHCVDHRARVCDADRRRADHNILVDFGEHAADAEYDHGSDLRVAAETDDDFGETALHALHQNA